GPLVLLRSLLVSGSTRERVPPRRHTLRASSRRRTGPPGVNLLGDRSHRELEALQVAGGAPRLPHLHERDGASAIGAVAKRPLVRMTLVVVVAGRARLEEVHAV